MKHCYTIRGGANPLGRGDALILVQHHFSRFDHDPHSIAFLERKLFGASPRYDALDRAFTDFHDDMRHDVAQQYLDDCSWKLIACG